MKLRKLTSALVAAGVLTSPWALGLGLGDLKLKSALNQPLQAEIKLLQTRELAKEEILPSMAADEEFDRAGVERFFFLSDIGFDVELSGNGDGTLLLSTKQSVQEPFLNFLVEVNWPNGRVLREYTVLLDPPVYEDEAPSVVVTPKGSSSPRAPKITPVKQSSVQRNSSAVVTPVSRDSGSSGINNQGRTVGSTDTLWDIAAEVRPDRSVTIQQTMMAIRELNPNAFVAGNINKIKKGAVLRIPTLDQIHNWQHGSAVEEVAAHNQRYKKSLEPSDNNTSDQVQLSAVNQDIQPVVQAPEDARLKIVRSDVSAASGGSASGDQSSSNVENLQNDLAISQENLDKASRENEKLSEKLESLQQQVEKLSRLVTLKDTQMAELQAGMAKSDDAAVESSLPSDEVVASPVESDSVDAMTDEVAASDLEDTLASSTPVDALDDIALTDEVKVDDVAVEEPVVADVPPPVNKPVIKPQGQPVEIQSPKQPSFLESVTKNPIWLVAIGAGSLFFVILLFMLSRRSYQRENELSEVMEKDSSSDQPASDTVQTEMDNIEQELEGLDLESKGFGQVSLDGDESLQPDDIVARADSFIAYGQFDNAVVLLGDAINQEAGRIDLRLKMLEVYAEMQDSQGFERQKQEILGLGADDVLAQINVLEQKLPSYMGETASVNAFDSNENLSNDKPLMGDADFDLAPGENSEDDELSYSLEDLESELASDLSGESSESEGTTELDSLDDLDFNLEEELGITEEAPDSIEQGSKESDFSIDMDFDVSDDKELSSGLDELDSLEIPDMDSESSLSEGISLEGGSELDGLSLDEGLELDSVTDDADLDDTPAVEDNVLGDGEIGLDSDFSLDELDSVRTDDELTVEPEADSSLEQDSIDLDTSDVEPLSSDELGEVLDVGVDLEDLAKSLGVDSADEVDLDAELASATEGSDDLGALSGDDLESETEVDVAVLDEVEEVSLVEEGASEESLDLDVALDVDESLEIDESLVDADSNKLSEGAEEESSSDVDLTEAAEVAQSQSEVSLADSVNSELTEDELDFFVGSDEVATKLDLARAYVDMGDVDGARDILEEVVLEGSEEQKNEAGELLNGLS